MIRQRNPAECEGAEHPSAVTERLEDKMIGVWLGEEVAPLKTSSLKPPRV